jgi:hypothetical protein
VDFDSAEAPVVYGLTDHAGDATAIGDRVDEREPDEVPWVAGDKPREVGVSPTVV